MSEIGQNGYDLILVPESRYKWTYRLLTFQIMQQFQLVVNSHGAASDIYLLDCHVTRFSPSLRDRTLRIVQSPCLDRGRHPFWGLLCFDIPIILVKVVV